MEPVLVNARYAGRPVTGVERVAEEIVRHLTVAHRLVGDEWGRGARGHLAEQVRPLLHPDLRHGLLWSPANTGPVLHRNHVVTIHDVATIRHPEFFNRSFRLLYGRLLGRLAASARVVVVPSSFTARELTELKIVESRKVVVIRNGVDGLSVSRATGASNEQLADIPDEYFLVVGSLDPRKNLRRLIGAYTRAAEASVVPPLLIVGGTGAAFTSEELRVPEGVRHLGRVDDQALQRLYAGATGVINVSLYEGFGLTVAEAARFDVPMMISDIPPHRELMNADAGVCWIDPWDVDDMAAGFLRLLSSAQSVHEVLGPSWAEAGSCYSELFQSLGWQD